MDDTYTIKPDIDVSASGKSLRQQLRVDGIPMIEVMPAGDKVARANAVTRYFEAGLARCYWMSARTNC